MSRREEEPGRPPVPAPRLRESEKKALYSTLPRNFAQDRVPHSPVTPPPRAARNPPPRPTHPPRGSMSRHAQPDVSLNDDTFLPNMTSVVSDERSYIELFLQMSLDVPACTMNDKNCSIRAVVDPILNSKFEKNNRNLLKIDVLVPMAFIESDENPISEVLRRGILIGPEGMEFVAGRWDPELLQIIAEDGSSQSRKHSKKRGSSKKLSFEFMMCKVAVGKPYPLSRLEYSVSIWGLKTRSIRFYIYLIIFIPSPLSRVSLFSSLTTKITH